MSGYVLSLWKGRLRCRFRSMESILQEVADCHEMPIDQLRSSSRRRRYITEARQEFYHRAHAAGWSLESIGRFIGRHHTIVLTGARRYVEREQEAAA